MVRDKRGYDSYHKRSASYTHARQKLLSVEASQGSLLFKRSLSCISGCPTPGNYRRKLQEGNYSGSSEVVFPDQTDDSLEAFDFSMLITIAEDHKFCQVQPDVDGFYTVCRMSTKFWIVLIPFIRYNESGGGNS